MKTVVLGDIHGSMAWKTILDQEEDVDEVVFVGDYFDSRLNLAPFDILENFKEIVAFARDPNNPIATTLLVGNHDYHYMPDYCTDRYSGYTPYMGYERHVKKQLDIFQMATMVQEKYLVSHAGISSQWVLHNTKQALPYDKIVETVNDMWEIMPKAFNLSGYEPSGDSSGNSPIWIRPYSLVQDNVNSIVTHTDYVQVFGHTSYGGVYSYKEEPLLGTGHILPEIAPDTRYILVDALPKEYLIIEDGVARCGKTQVPSRVK